MPGADDREQREEGGAAGLTEFGRQVVDRAETLGMIIDLVHASPRMVEEVLARTARPPVVPTPA